MADASSIRKVTSPVAPSAGQPGPVSGVLTPESQVGSGFYEGAVRFLYNQPGYNYNFTSTSGVAKTRKTGQAFINSGSQWVPVGNVVLSLPVANAAAAVDQTVFVADRPYNLVSATEVHTACGSTSAAVTLNKLVAGGVGSITVNTGGSGYTSNPTVHVAAPPAGGVQATATAVADTASDGTLDSVTVTNPGAGYVTAPAVTFSGGGGAGTGTATAVLGTLPSQGTDMLTAAFGLTTAVPINTVTSGTLSATLANTQLNTGDRLALHFAGTVTGLAGANITVVLQPQ